MRRRTRSPVLTTLHALYDHYPATPWSWRRLNAALQGQLSCLITVGAVFQLTDFCCIAADTRLRFASWAGDDHGERFYTTAITLGNLSACQSFEHWKQRPPYIWEGERLHLGSAVLWKRERVTLTSFAPQGTAITLCSYKPLPEGAPCPTCHHFPLPHSRPAILHRYRVTVEMLHAADPTRQAATGTKKPRGAVGQEASRGHRSRRERSS